jgi:hypothetical protein
MRTLCQVLDYKGNNGPLPEPLLSLKEEFINTRDAPAIISPKLLFLANVYAKNPHQYWFKLKYLLTETMVFRRHINFGKF